MKSRSSAVYVVLALAAVALWFVRPARRTFDANQTNAPTAASPTTSGSKAEPATPGNEPSSAVTTGGTSLPAGTVTTNPGLAGRPGAVTGALPNSGDSTPSPGQKAQIDVGRVRHMISDYHTLMGENPVGTNAEIMKQMMGGNSHQATLGPPDGMTLNSQGELVDQWGTPFFFHQLSRDKMEVRSAGPDKIMWTADDVVIR